MSLDAVDIEAIGKMVRDAVRQELTSADAPALRRALELVGKDMHTGGTRPCETCAFVSKVLGQPFGCYLVQAEIASSHAPSR